MPFGKYKGVPMASIKKDYLLWIYDQIQTQHNKRTTWQNEVYVYVGDNLVT
jgi:hypothetical protein